MPTLGFGKLFNVLQSPIGRVASQPMRNIETFPSKHMYLYLSLVERKVAEFYHNMVKMTYCHCFLQTIDGVLVHFVERGWIDLIDNSIIANFYKEV